MTGFVLGCALLLPAALVPARDTVLRHGFWADVQFGHGRLAQSSDQEPHEQHNVFVLSFGAGAWVTRHLRLGAELGGWLIESFSTNDPSVGESVSQVRAVARFYPAATQGLFLKAAVGRSMYTNEHPLEFDSDGWGGTVGAGYDLRMGRSFSLTPAVSYNAGSLGDVRNLVTTIRNRRYRAVDVTIALTYR